MSKVYDQLKSLEASIKRQPAAQELEQQEAIEEAQRRTEADTRLTAEHEAQRAGELRLQALAQERAAAEQAQQDALAARIKSEKQLIQQLQNRQAHDRMVDDLARLRMEQEVELNRLVAAREAQEYSLLSGQSGDLQHAVARPLPAGERVNPARKYFLVAFVGVLVVAIYIVIGNRPFNDRLPMQPAVLPVVEPAVQPAVTAAVQQAVEPSAQPPGMPIPPAPGQEETAASSTDEIEANIRQDIQLWADAWSRQDAQVYLACYAQEFMAPAGMSRADWEALRKSRLRKYHSIEVKLRDIDVVYAGGDEATARFTQDFVGDGYREMGTHKEFQMKNVDGQWLIINEKEL
jgi:hypothetical protein